MSTPIQNPVNCSSENKQELSTRRVTEWLSDPNAPNAFLEPTKPQAERKEIARSNINVIAAVLLKNSKPNEQS
jgi:hypothetical protein